jgi:hypothetical protein
MGSAALPELETATRSRDPEVRFAAHRILIVSSRTSYFAAVVFRGTPGSFLWRLLSRKAQRKLKGSELHHLALIERMGSYGSEGTADYIIDVLLRGNTWDSVSASVALGALSGDESISQKLILAFSHADLRVRPYIVQALGRVCAESAREALGNLRKSENHRISTLARVSYADVGTRLGARRAAVAVLAGEPTEDAAQRMAESAVFLEQIVSDLARTRDPGVMPRVLAFLRSAGLWNIIPPHRFAGPASTTWIGPLVRAYESASSQAEKIWMLGVLAKQPRDSRVSVLLVQSLLDPMLAGFAESVVEELCEELAPSLGALALRMEDPWRRTLAKILAKNGGYFAAAELGRILRETGASYAAVLLGTMEPFLAREHLLGGLTHPRSARACARVLGSLGQVTGFPLLASLLSKGFCFPEIIEGLGRSGDPRALPMLLAYSRRLRYRGPALRGLVHLAHPKALPIFLAHLTDPRHAITALEGLRAVADPRTSRVVLHFLRFYRFRDCRADDKLRKTAHEVLHHIERR